MSSFFCRLGVIDDVVDVVREIEDQPHDPESLGKELMFMNAAAVGMCYPQSYCDQIEIDGQVLTEQQWYSKQAKEYRYQPASRSHLQRAQSLSCLVYQCTEGSVVNTDLYKRLTDVMSEIERRGVDWRSDDGGLEWNRCRAPLTSGEELGKVTFNENILKVGRIKERAADLRTRYLRGESLDPKEMNEWQELRIILDAVDKSRKDIEPEYWSDEVIKDDYITEYAQELAEKEMYGNDLLKWPLKYIDWDQAAIELKDGYRRVELIFDDRHRIYWVSVNL